MQMDAKTLHVMVGAPGSGKSTYAEQMCDADDVVVSSDAIRGELFGDVTVQRRREEVYNIFYSRIGDALDDGHDVWADATNLDEWSRRNYSDIAHDHGADLEAIVMDTPLGTCQLRNSARERTVPRYVVKSMHRRMTTPTESEGFSHIVFVEPDNNRVEDAR